IVPYQSTAKFVSALAEKGVQYRMLPLFDADHEYAERQDLKESLLTHLKDYIWRDLHRGICEFQEHSSVIWSPTCCPQEVTHAVLPNSNTHAVNKLHSAESSLPPANRQMSLTSILS
ncbi:unnamed protein product, partial [Dicrocoelium dendriticum]